MEHTIYVSFGSNDRMRHEITRFDEPFTTDGNTVVAIPCVDESDGRKKAFELFDGMFATTYFNEGFVKANFEKFGPIEIITTPEWELV